MVRALAAGAAGAVAEVRALVLRAGGEALLPNPSARAQLAAGRALYVEAAQVVKILVLNRSALALPGGVF